jgi:hypothetical protein
MTKIKGLRADKLSLSGDIVFDYLACYGRPLKGSLRRKGSEGGWGHSLYF